MAMLVPLVVLLAVAPAVEARLPDTRGTIAVARPAPSGARASPTAVFADSVENALLEAGYVVIPHPEHARQVATIDVKRTAYGAALAKGASAGRAMPMLGGGNGAGAGVSVGFGSKVNVGEMIATELTLTVSRRGDKGPGWQGRAVTYQVSGTRADEPAALARKLTAAVLRNLNQPSGVLVSVP